MANTQRKLAKLNGDGAASGSNTLSYPLNVEEFENFIEIRRKDGKSGATKGRPIQLYIPTQVEESLSADYATESLFGKNIASGFGIMGTQMLENYKAARGGDEEAMKKLGAGAPEIVKILGRRFLPDGEVRNTIESQLRETSNPALTYLFKAMNHREFSFTFEMMAKNQKETDAIRSIIRELKAAETPSFVSDSGELLLRYPDPISVKYRKPDYLHKFKDCVIKTIQVNYNAGGSTYTQFKNYAPTHVEMTITFEELNIITQEDVEAGY